VSIRTVLVVFLAIICGMTAALGMNQLRRPSSGEPQIETAPVVVAAVNVARGAMLTPKAVEIRDWPKALLPNGALANVEDAAGRSAAIPFVVGEPILEAKLSPKDAGRGLAALIPNGMRAYTIQSSRTGASVAGFILPGNKVDVLLNLKSNNPQDSTGGGSTTTLLQSVEILAVEQQLDAPADNKTNPKDLTCVTLLVNPAQAALLDLGQNMGQLTLSLRNPEDEEEALVLPTTLTDMRYRQEKPPEEPKVAKERQLPDTPVPSDTDLFEIRTLRGSVRGRVLVSK
jgi:pilus assembly protein CpaB